MRFIIMKSFDARHDSLKLCQARAKPETTFMGFGQGLPCSSILLLDPYSKTLACQVVEGH